MKLSEISSRRIRKSKTLLLIPAFLITGCRQTPSDFGIHFEQITMEMDTTLTDEPSSPVCRIQIKADYPADTTTLSRKLNRILTTHLLGTDSLLLPVAADTFCNNYLQGYMTHLKELYTREAQTQTIADWYQYQREITGTYLPGGKHIIRYQMDYRYKEGGASSCHETFYINLDAHSGALLTIDSIVKPTERIQLEAFLMKELLKKQDVQHPDELKEQGFLKTTDLYIPENFCLEEDGILFHFNADELASFHQGALTLFLNYDDIKDLLKDKTIEIWSRF